jgi:hypothetical protein
MTKRDLALSQAARLLTVVITAVAVVVITAVAVAAFGWAVLLVLVPISITGVVIGIYGQPEDT